MNQDFTLLLSNQSIIVFILVLSRISGMLATAPFFSTFPIPMQIKAALAGIVTFIMYPIVMQHSHIQVPNELITLTLMVTKEVFVGVLIGFCANLIFIGIQMAGQLLSVQMGLSVGDVLDPVTRQNVPIIGQFYLFLASMVFLFLNGHQWLFTSVFDSYNSLPIGINIEFSSGLVDRILYFTSQLFTIAFSLIMPIFAVLFVIDVILGFMSKMMPQMNVFMVAIPLKIYVGLLMMILFMTSTSVYLSGLISNMLDNLKSIFM